MEDVYASWEWQPVDRMPNGCNELEVRLHDGTVREICSCDYWWYSPERKTSIEAFRFNE